MVTLLANTSSKLRPGPPRSGLRAPYIKGPPDLGTQDFTFLILKNENNNL